MDGCLAPPAAGPSREWGTRGTIPNIGDRRSDNDERSVERTGKRVFHQPICALAWILSFGYTLGDTFVRIALWFQGGEQGAWTLSALAAAATVAFLLHLRRDRRAALALSIGVGVYELLNQGLYLYSLYFVNEDPESLRRMLCLLTSGHWWVYRCLWLPLLAGGYLALRRNRRAWPHVLRGQCGSMSLDPASSGPRRAAASRGCRRFEGGSDGCFWRARSSSVSTNTSARAPSWAYS